MKEGVEIADFALRIDNLSYREYSEVKRFVQWLWIRDFNCDTLLFGFACV
jgi:hypothetical protein